MKRRISGASRYTLPTRHARRGIHRHIHARIQTVISGEVAVRGSLQEMLATGSVTVPHGRVILDQIPWGGPPEVQPWELTVPGVYGPGPEAVSVADDKAAATALGPGFSLSFLRTDLAIAMPQNLWVQAPRTAVELSGELRVTKELKESFALSGSIDTVRGYATYYGKKFEIMVSCRRGLSCSAMICLLAAYCSLS